MTLPVILILIGVFTIVCAAQIITLKTYLRHRREELNK